MDIWKPPTLDELRARYIRLEVEAARSRRNHRQISEEIALLLGQQRDLGKRASQLDQCDNQIKGLRQRRDGFGPFDMSGRIENEEKLMRAKTAKVQAERSLHDDYAIEPEGIPAKWKELEQMATELKNKRDQLPDVRQIRKEQQTVAQKYQDARQRGAENEHKQENKQEHKQAVEPMNLSDRLSVAKAEIELEKLAAQGKEQGREQEKKQERDKGKDHGRGRE